MDVENTLQSYPASSYLAPMERYKEAISRTFPALHERIVNNCSIFPSDVVTLGYFLEHYPRKVVALEIGAFVGISAFCMASHPEVSRVISVDPNPVISDELTANSDRWVGSTDLESLEKLRVFDVARTILAQFGEEQEKIELCEGMIGSTQVGAKGDTIAGLRKVEVPAVDPTDGEGLVALVDGLHTRDGVRQDLSAIFKSNPQAVALLDDCRYGWGHLVQAGVVDFMEKTTHKYQFRLFGDLGPGLASSSFGIVYPESMSQEVGEVLSAIRKVSREQLDPLRVLKQKEDLSWKLDSANRQLEQARHNESHLEHRASDLEVRLAEAGRRSTWLEATLLELREHNARLNAHYSSRRYELADAIAARALRIPGARSLLCKNNAGRNGQR